jgi:predicted RNA-binding Zn ribbon-like protein
VQETGQPRIFQLLGGHAALDLVNTLDWRFRADGPEELLSTYGSLVDFAEQTKLLTLKQARRLVRDTTAFAGDRVLEDTRELREALADLIYGGIDERNDCGVSLVTLERFFRSARAQTRLARNGCRLQWEWAGAEARAEFPLWALTRAAARLMLSENSERVRACDNPDCRWLFLDTSKNRTRRWCDMKLCGNRMKARRFKALHGTS